MLMQLKDIMYDIHVQLCYVCFVLIFLKIEMMKAFCSTIHLSVWHSKDNYHG